MTVTFVNTEPLPKTFLKAGSGARPSCGRLAEPKLRIKPHLSGERRQILFACKAATIATTEQRPAGGAADFRRGLEEHR